MNFAHTTTTGKSKCSAHDARLKITSDKNWTMFKNAEDRNGHFPWLELR